MPKMEFKKLETLSRQEAAARMMAVAQALGNSDEFELERGGEKLQLDVPEEVTLKLEVEIEDGGTELDVEIKWSSQAAATAPAAPGDP